VTETTFTFRVDEALKDEFSTVAKAHDRTGAQLLRDFMRDYVKQQQKSAEYDAWLRAKVERSRASADAGNMLPAAEVEAKFTARRAKTRRQLEASK
jgi:predicted transcriptional regulator